MGEKGNEEKISWREITREYMDYDCFFFKKKFL